jgi:para-nitrobenzyl esterase
MPSINRRTVLQTAVFGGLTAAVARPLFAESRGTVVDITSGKLQGVESNGVKIFKGVPYGAPTGGSARFKAPQPVVKWTGVKQAVVYGPSSPQGASMLPAPAQSTGVSLVGDAATFSEDCLYLNVWTPSLNSGKRPVMVWLHGGGFSSGSGASPLYDGTNLARTHDVVVLTINHRLNAFGYLDLSRIASNEYADSSMAGMHDVVLALQWVKDNIAQFGGDPGNVTIFGESGGGRKVSVLMATPPAQGLFHRAIVQSGSALRMDTPVVADERANAFLAALGLGPKQIDKLIALPPEQLLTAVNKVARTLGQFRPTTGAPSLPAHPFDPIAPAISANIPMMIGTNLTEASFAMGRDPKVLALDEAGVLERIKNLVPAQDAAKVLDTYKRIYPGMAASDILFRVATDRGYFLDSTIQAARKADLKRAPAFVYSFNWMQPLPRAQDAQERPLSAGRTHAPHGSEIAFAFGNAHLARGENPQALALLMSEAWASFARTGNPSTTRLSWAPYDSTSRPTMIFDKQSRVENDPRGEQRKLMLAFGSQQYEKREIPGL